MSSSIYDISVKYLDGKTVSMDVYRGKVLLIVNTASGCGFTPQYKGLQHLYETYKDQGLVILGFPCNQFGAQEPGNEHDIQTFCEVNYAVTFPLFSKIDVNGTNTHPLYQLLKSKAPGFLGSEAIKWNFTKFLVDKAGNISERYAPQTTPESIESDIKKLLEKLA